MANWLAPLNWNEQGLITAIAQDAHTHEILMLAWMNRQALEQTLATGEAVYWSRSRGKLWHKGLESGHIQKVLELRLDCDGDALLLKVEQQGGIACHTGRRSCFSWQFEPTQQAWLPVEPVLKDPAEIYPSKA